MASACAFHIRFRFKNWLGREKKTHPKWLFILYYCISCVMITSRSHTNGTACLFYFIFNVYVRYNSFAVMWNFVVFVFNWWAKKRLKDKWSRFISDFYQSKLLSRTYIKKEQFMFNFVITPRIPKLVYGMYSVCVCVQKVRIHI